jgi:hypothetical protein
MKRANLPLQQAFLPLGRSSAHHWIAIPTGPAYIFVKHAQSVHHGALKRDDGFSLAYSTCVFISSFTQPTITMALPIGIQTAINPSNIDAVPELLAEVTSAGSTLFEAGGVSLKLRLEMLAKARELVHALETPREAMIQHLWAQVCWPCSTKRLHG